MRTFFGLLIIVVIGLTSCEGRRTSSQSLAENIEKFNKSVTFEVTVYEPEDYFEREVDTTLSNGFHVKIKTYTDLENNVLFTKIKDTINYQTYYRNYKFDISVEKEGQLIYSESFDKKKVNSDFNYNSKLESDSDLYNFDTLAVLKSIEVNQNPSNAKQVNIDIMFAIPESGRYASHTLFIDEKGKSNIVKIDVK